MTESRPEDKRAEDRTGTGAVVTRITLLGAVALVAFLLGFVPARSKAHSYSRQLEQTNRKLNISRIENLLATAAINAQRANYVPARQAASQFYTSLREETDKDKDSALSSAQRQEAGKLLVARDEVITLLARSDPASVPKLMDLYLAFHKVVGS